MGWSFDPESQLSVSSQGSGSSKKCHPGNSTQSRRSKMLYDSAVLADKDLLVDLMPLLSWLLLN